MRFNDGQEFDTTGALRVEWRRDGYYVIGDGLLVPVDDEDEGYRLIHELRGDDPGHEPLGSEDV